MRSVSAATSGVVKVGLGAAGVAEAYGVAAAIDLLPGVSEAAVFVLRIAAGGGVELDELVFVDGLVGYQRWQWVGCCRLR